MPVVMLVTAMQSHAALVISQTDTNTYDSTVEFNEVAVADDALVTNQFSAFGVTFESIGGSKVHYNRCNYGTGTVSNTGVITTFDTGCRGTNRILDWAVGFNEVVNEASFLMACSLWR